MPKRLPRHLHRQVTQHGRTVWYFRRGHGPRTRITAPYDSQEFWAEYNAALAGTAAPAAKTTVPDHKTVAGALDLYRKSSAWADLSQATRGPSETIYQAIVATSGTHALVSITTDDIIATRDKHRDAPAQANHIIAALRRFFKWAADHSAEGGKLLKSDPTDGIKKLKPKKKGGIYTWTEDDIQKFEVQWPLGTRERLALDIMLYTGLARSDVVRLGKQHISRGQITIRMFKKRGDGTVSLPLLAPLQRSIDATPAGDLTFLVAQATGQPLPLSTFSQWFRKACRTAGCPGSPHGLRKAAAVRCALNGATVRQLMAMFGWGTEAMAILYTRQADKIRLASGAQDYMVAPEHKADK